MPLTSRVNVTITADQNSALDLVTVSAPLVKKMIQDLTNGSGLNQANKLFSDTRTVLTAATDSIDLNGGGLLDALGAALNLTRLVALILRSSPTNTTNFTCMGDANSVPILNTAATTFTLQPGGIFVFTAPSVAGVVVTPGTGDIVKLVNAAGASANFDIIVIGS